ncbi:SAV_2336 N-terminal domain-related protein [Streptomyces sp. ATE26]|uniref:SAV_2336 N-terminal domain-related protein n=1 Tax=Streptomyces sp. ATE26 TaxID=2954237 RepID=UPI0024830E64|nr:SAV_2336 N-terminal domain-related protein [Streptomyces sp. ATE26]MDI1458889.1 SAV_2336 N-terminal domain-related protein [Streptomyces sp. ATE26]
MTDVLGPLVRTLAAALGKNADATAIADALWLAAAPTAERMALGSAPEPSHAEVVPAPQTAQGTPETAEPAPPRLEEDTNAATLYESLPDARPVPGVSVTVTGGRDLPRATELRRALRPFKRRYPRGKRSALDLDATVRDFRRSGELAPVFSPSPEPWFELLLVIDTSPSMAVWNNTNTEFATLLAGLGAFRRVRTWGLWPSNDPTVTDHQGRPIAPGQASSSDGRRLVIVLSDCVAPGWRQPETWRLLRRWGATAPLALLNPLPSRLWHRTGLNLPAIRVKQRRPALKNTDLDFQLPLLLRTLPGAENADWQALPTLTFSPHSLARWADTLMRGAPHGYDAVLIPRTGLLPSRFRTPQTSHRMNPDPTEAFLRTASPTAVRLAALCSPFTELSLPLLHLIRQRLLPKAGVGDLAELLTSPLVHIKMHQDAPPVVVFAPASRERLAGHLSRRDAWLTHDALSRHIAARSFGGAENIRAAAVSDAERVPGELIPFARASNELLTLLREGEPTRPVLALQPPKTSTTPRTTPSLRGLPDRKRSAAVLIGVPHRRNSLQGMVADLTGMRSFLTSPDGWSLPNDRCITLPNPRVENEVIEAIRRACSMADDTVLLYFLGHAEVDPSGRTTWLLEHGLDQSRRIRRLYYDLIIRALDEVTPQHIMLILDHGESAAASLAPNDWVPNARMASRRVDIQTLFAGSAHGTPGRGSLTQRILQMATQGVPGGPEFLDLRAISSLLEKPDITSRADVFSSDSSLPMPAFARNRAWPQEEISAHFDSTIEEAYNVTRERLREALPRTYRGAYQREADRLLSALLDFAVKFINGTEQADSKRELIDAVQGFLGRRGFSTEREVLHGQRRADIVWRSKSAAFVVEMMNNDVDPLRSSFGPLSYHLMLSRQTHAGAPDILDCVSTVVADPLDDVAISLDEGPCLVVIRLPAPDFSAPDPLSATVESACDELLGESIAFSSDDDMSTGWDLNDVELPAGLTDLTIQGITPDSESIVWETVEEYEHGLILGRVTVDAELTLEGVMHKSDYAGADVRLLEDLNDHMVEVSLNRRAQLVFDARQDLEAPVELQFSGMNAPESHPHDSM